jgi:hypothetical protein
LGELARRYFRSHGPATLADYAWWSGLALADARAGLALAQPELAAQHLNGQDYWGPAGASVSAGRSSAAYLLPAFDEFVLGYTDRTVVLDARHSPRVLGSNGIFYPTLVIDGQVIGTWKRTLKPKQVDVSLSSFAPLTRPQRAAAAAAAERYGAFLGRRPVVDVG